MTKASDQPRIFLPPLAGEEPSEAARGGSDRTSPSVRSLACAGHLPRARDTRKEPDRRGSAKCTQCNAARRPRSTFPAPALVGEQECADQTRRTEMNCEPVLADRHARFESAFNHPPADEALQAAECEQHHHARQSATLIAPVAAKKRNGTKNTNAEQPPEQAVRPLPPIDRLEIRRGSCRGSRAGTAGCADTSRTRPARPDRSAAARRPSPDAIR
jgi:hypothetical protein